MTGGFSKWPGHTPGMTFIFLYVYTRIKSLHNSRFRGGYRSLWHDACIGRCATRSNKRPSIPFFPPPDSDRCTSTQSRAWRHTTWLVHRKTSFTILLVWLIMIGMVIFTTVIFRCFAHILWTLWPVTDEGTWFERNSRGSKYYTKGSRSSSSITREGCKQMMVARAFRAVLVLNVEWTFRT